MGGNAPGCREALEAATAYILTMAEPLKSTPLYPTDPEYTADVAPYLNRILVLATDLPLDEFRTRTKEYEKNIRAAADCAPHVILDIDIVLWNDTVLRPVDASSRYFAKGLSLL